MKIEASTGSVRHLKPAHLDGDTTAIIERVEEKPLYNPYTGTKVPQILVFFTITSHPDELSSIIANTTVQRQLVAACGSDETDTWIGQKVTLFPTVAPNGKPAVRVKAHGEMA